jgi:hypothetical protein
MINFLKTKRRNLISEAMKSKTLKIVLIAILGIIVSCDDPETVVTDIVHADGSVLRKIEMKNLENKFEINKIQVPFDSTWSVRDSIEINGKDTTWVKRAEKLFANVSDLNKMYAADSGYNRQTKRSCEFVRKFRWFNTEYKFSEIVDKQFKYGYPVRDFLNADELAFFNSTDKAQSKFENGPDSLKYKAMKDTVDVKTEKWLSKSAASEWIKEFSDLTANKGGEELSFKSLKSRENELYSIAFQDMEHFDSLWKNGIILKRFIGEDNMNKFRAEADSSINIVSRRLFVDFHSYTVKIVMPGKLIGTNGLIDSSKNLFWPVKTDFFYTEPYVMWAESKESNKWAWIVTGVFILFVIAGVIFKSIKRG